MSVKSLIATVALVLISEISRIVLIRLIECALLDELLHLLVAVLNALRLGAARVLISLICRIGEHDLVPIGLRLLLSERLGPKILLDGENWTTVLV